MKERMSVSEGVTVCLASLLENLVCWERLITEQFSQVFAVFPVGGFH